ncbi:uncharacterized protein NPIL_146751 [Nephila pilipes]|uniref:Uncharacterized protein n=1 Tax=Nephila pilipes TaxID=299642 RepID=A0A8X6PW79_NEPPI|nr:uncharacterized protein NPIL_146751 [Nephila pilipes]
MKSNKLHHRISTDKKPEHSKCPTGVSSWCFFQSAIAKGEKPGSHKLHVRTPIKRRFLSHILPIYQRLASYDLLERCVNCGTQNANERLHYIISPKCPKEIFVLKDRVKQGLTEAISEFNKGTL